MRTAHLLLTALPLALAPAVAAAPAPMPLVQDDLPTMAQAQALIAANDFAGAAEAFGKISAAQPKNAQAVFMHAYCLHMKGDLKAAHDRHLDAAEFPETRVLALYNHACVHALWNEADVAFRSLREAIDAGFTDVGQLEGDTDMANIREDPRFAAIVAELKGEAPAPTPAPEAGPIDLGSMPAERRFDWYVGEWQMFNGDALEQIVSVARAFDGKGLQVTMKDPEGQETARSIYAYDAAEGAWRQTWMSATGQVISMTGGLDGGALALRVRSDSAGTSLNGRSVFQGVRATEFEYAWQTTSDEGASWDTVATRTFKKQ